MVTLVLDGYVLELHSGTGPWGHSLMVARASRKNQTASGEASG